MIEEKYAHKVALAGGVPFLIPSITGDMELIKNTMSSVDGLLLPGSRDMDPKFYNEEPHPKIRPMSIERTETEFAVLNEALNKNMPVFGICGGMQLVNVHYGGSLYQDIYSYLDNLLPHEKGAPHDITVPGGTKLHSITGVSEFQVRSYHHQSVNKIGDGLQVCALSPDGIVEGIESLSDPFVLGLQWHPELEVTEISDRIFEAFINECRKVK